MRSCSTRIAGTSGAASRKCAMWVYSICRMSGRHSRARSAISARMTADWWPRTCAGRRSSVEARWSISTMRTSRKTSCELGVIGRVVLLADGGEDEIDARRERAAEIPDADRAAVRERVREERRDEQDARLVAAGRGRTTGPSERNRAAREFGLPRAEAAERAVDQDLQKELGLLHREVGLFLQARLAADAVGAPARRRGLPEQQHPRRPGQARVRECRAPAAWRGPPGSCAESGASTWLASPGCSVRNGAVGTIAGFHARKCVCGETANVRGSSKSAIISGVAGPSPQSASRESTSRQLVERPPQDAAAARRIDGQRLASHAACANHRW